MGLQVDDVVRVVSRDKYGGRYYQRTGIIVRVLNSGKQRLLGVELDGVVNPKSKYNAFWFHERHLQRFYGERNTDEDVHGFDPKQKMHHDLHQESEELFMITPKTVLIRFLDNPNEVCQLPYACYDESIEPNDTVVVCTGRHGFTLAVVSDQPVPENAHVECGREIVNKVDFTAYNARVDKRKRMSELKAKLDDRARQMQKLAVYEALAANDPEARALLEEFKTLMSE